MASFWHQTFLLLNLLLNDEICDEVTLICYIILNDNFFKKINLFGISLYLSLIQWSEIYLLTSVCLSFCQFVTQFNLIFSATTNHRKLIFCTKPDIGYLILCDTFSDLSLIFSVYYNNIYYCLLIDAYNYMLKKNFLLHFISARTNQLKFQWSYIFVLFTKWIIFSSIAYVLPVARHMYVLYITFVICYCKYMYRTFL